MKFDRPHRALALVIAAAGSLALAAPALAATATVDYGTGVFTYQAGAGESNTLQVSPLANPDLFLIYEKAVPQVALDQIGSAPACALPEIYKFRCPLGGLSRADVRLGDGTDTLNYSIAHPVVVTAGPGSKTITTGPGADSIDVRNGSADSVACGGGTDTVYAEAADTVAADCELVNPVNAPPVTAPPSGAATLTVGGAGGNTGTGADGTGTSTGTGNGDSAPEADTLATKLGLSLPTLTFIVPKPDVAVVPLACAVSAADGCHGEVVLSLPARTNHAQGRHAGRVIAARGHYQQQARRRNRRLGRREFELGAGDSVKLPVRIALRGHFTLASRRSRRAKALIQVVQRDAAGKVASVATSSVTLRFKHRWARIRSGR